MTSWFVFSRRFASSITLAENPLHIFPLNEHIPKILDPVELFTNCKKYEKPTINQTKILHAYFLKSNILQSDIFLANSLTDWYCKVNALNYARKLFDQIRKPNVVSWNILISGHNQSSMYEESWRLFCIMHLSGVDLNPFTYGSVLSACSALECVPRGRQVYGLVMKNGFFSNGYVRSGMIDLFAKHGCFDEALRVFMDLSCDDNVVCWNAIISGAVKNGDYMEALDLFCQMCSEGSTPNSFTFSSILTACSTLEDLGMGRGIHGLVIKCGAQEDVFVGTSVIDLYAKCGSMDEAVKEFSHMPMRNVVSWTAMISGFVQKDDSISALLYFNEMRRMGEEVNKYTVSTILSACAAPAMFGEGTQVHSWILKSGLYQDSSVKSSLINMYSKLGAINLSEMVFKETGCIEDADRWAVMITAFAQNEASEKAITLFQRMFHEGLRPGKFCNSSVLSIINCLNFGRQVHCYTLKAGLVFDVSVGSALFTMYSKCGSLEESYEVFKQLSGKDIVSWGSMIAGFAEHGLQSHAIDLFREMIEETLPDQLSLAAVLTACSTPCSLKMGKEIHGYALRAGVGKDLVVGGALLTMYARYGRLNCVRRVFEMMPQKDEVTCSSIVSGYAQNGYNEEVLLLFREMLIADLKIDSFIFSSVLRVVTVLNRASMGTQLHGQIIKLGLNKKVSVGSSLIMMYSEFGRVDDCQKVFDQIQSPDLICWTAMIVSCARHGKGSEALKFYELMGEEGIEPDSLTFVGVLSACSHSGLVEEGYFIFNSMVKDHGIVPSHRHYSCIVDILGRAGRLEEAGEFINSMPIEPNALIWSTFLGACKVHGNIELGKLAAKKVLDLEPCDAGTYVSLSNICADLGLWEEVENVRSLMKGTQVKKAPGWTAM